MDQDHPALVAARSSWRCVMAKDKEAWLALMAEDVHIEDPIGVGPTNPTGKGILGKQEVAEFFDRNIAPNQLEIEPIESYAAGAESAHLLRLTTSFPNGVKMVVRGVFTYKLNDAGKLQSLRGYWSVQDAEVHKPS